MATPGDNGHKYTIMSDIEDHDQDKNEYNNQDEDEDQNDNHNKNDNEAEDENEAENENENEDQDEAEDVDADKSKSTIGKRKCAAKVIMILFDKCSSAHILHIGQTKQKAKVSYSHMEYSGLCQVNDNVFLRSC